MSDVARHTISTRLDDPERWLFWTLDEAAVLLGPAVLGLAANAFVIGLVAGLGAWALLRRAKRGGGADTAVCALYWFLLEVGGRRGGTEVYRMEEIELRASDRVRWTRNDADLGLVNSRTAEVAEVGNGRVKLRLEEGRNLELGRNDPQLRHFDHAWASTVHAFQGRTVDNVIAAMEARHPHLTTQKSFYVEISRARDRAELVTDDANELRAQLQAVTGERLAALEGVGETTEAARNRGVDAARPEGRLPDQGPGRPPRKRLTAMHRRRRPRSRPHRNGVEVPGWTWGCDGVRWRGREEAGADRCEDEPRALARPDLAHRYFPNLPKVPRSTRRWIALRRSRSLYSRSSPCSAYGKKFHGLRRMGKALRMTVPIRLSPTYTP